MLNREEEYEELLITRLKETIIFSDDYPDKFVSFVNQNVASHNIENSLMNVQALSQEEILCFVKNALYILQLMDNNLFDVEISSTMQDKQVKKWIVKFCSNLWWYTKLVDQLNWWNLLSMRFKYSYIHF